MNTHQYIDTLVEQYHLPRILVYSLFEMYGAEHLELWCRAYDASRDTTTLQRLIEKCKLIGERNPQPAPKPRLRKLTTRQAAQILAYRFNISQNQAEQIERTFRNAPKRTKPHELLQDHKSQYPTTLTNDIIFEIFEYRTRHSPSFNGVVGTWRYQLEKGELPDVPRRRP